MRVYIAEKPSMAAEIAKCLSGPLVRKAGYLQTGEGLVTWLYGHIMRLAEPGEYDAKYEKWNSADLPIIPEKWKLLVSDNCEQQFQVIQELLQQAAEIVHAGDPDREGQLLVDEVLEYLENQKPVKRLLLNALDEKSIKTALTELQDNSKFKGLKNSALARQRADWLIGMNVTRAYTLAARSRGYDMTFPVGRVKTPTLSLVVRREREITSFKSVEHYGFKVELQHANGLFTAVWKPKEGQIGLDSENRLVDRAVGGALKNKLESCPVHGVITEWETKEKSLPQPLPYSLSALQVAAGKKYGYSPQVVLETAQSLYEKKLTSYPRSDCDYLPSNQLAAATVILQHLAASVALTDWVGKADKTIVSRAWNDEKITAHHAIIPTQLPCNPAKLTEVEHNLYVLIARAYLAQFYPAHVYDQTTVTVLYAEEAFKASGKVIRQQGWRELFSGEQEEKEEKGEDAGGTLPLMQKGDAAECIALKSLKKTTKPPERFTESSLLQAMKEIHKYVKDDSLKTHLKSVSGIGTEATRAGIIEDLLSRQFLVLDKKRLKPTEAAFTLIDGLPDELTFPDTTAIWEDQLKQMESGSVPLTGFLAKQKKTVTILCRAASRAAGLEKSKSSVNCPGCNVGILLKRTGKNGAFWGCSRYREGCSVTVPDKDGKPDLVAYKRKALLQKAGRVREWNR